MKQNIVTQFEQLDKLIRDKYNTSVWENSYSEEERKKMQDELDHDYNFKNKEDL